MGRSRIICHIECKLLKMAKNKSLRITAILIPLFLAGILLYLYNSYNNKKQTAEQLQSLPNFTLKTIDGNLFASNDLAELDKKVLIYFNPSCEYCQAEAEELAHIKNKYPDIYWIWVSSSSLEEITAFASKNQLIRSENIFWCQDSTATLYRKLDMSSVPFFLAYDKNNKQVFKNKGAVKLEKIVKSFEEGK